MMLRKTLNKEWSSLLILVLPFLVILAGVPIVYSYYLHRQHNLS